MIGPMIPLFHAKGLIAILITALPTDAVAARAKDKLPMGGEKPLELPTVNVIVKRVQNALKDDVYYRAKLMAASMRKLKEPFLNIKAEEA